MTRVQASVQLPYLLRLPAGMFGVLQLGLATVEREDAGAGTAITTATMTFDTDATEPDDRQRVAMRKADELLRHTNRLIRWYRTVTGQAAVTELTRAQASPVRLFIDGADEQFVDPLVFEPAIRPPNQKTPQEIADQVRAGLNSDSDPPVGELFVLDAQEAIRSGRFREAVLFCWSAIDSQFNKAYDELVDAKLGTEWSKGRDFFKGKTGDMPLRVKMTACLRLLANASLFQEPLWERLVTSYDKRNKIIHGGESAVEADAENALWVAHEVLRILGGLATR